MEGVNYDPNLPVRDQIVAQKEEKLTERIDNESKKIDGEAEASKWPLGFRTLSKILKTARGAATFQVVEFVKRHLTGTKLILVLGETGTGKTSLLEELIGKDLKVGNTLNSGTCHYEIFPAVIHDENYLFVDTAGFGAGDLDDIENFKNIMSCLLAFGPFVQIAGVLFLHDSKKDRMTAGELKTIRWLQCFCGPEYYQNITIVTTKWDEYNTKALQKARTRLEYLRFGEDIGPILDPSFPYVGASLYNHGIPGGGLDENWDDPLDRDEESFERATEVANVIRNRYSNPALVQLQARLEIDNGTAILQTMAAKALESDPVNTKIRLRGNLAVVRNIDDPDPGQEEIPQESATEDTEETRTTESFDWFEMDWFNIAKQMAIFFMKKHQPTTTKIATNFAESAWEKVKSWWRGPPPEC